MFCIYTSQARWSQNSKFVSHLMYYEVDSLKRSYSESPLLCPRITVVQITKFSTFAGSTIKLGVKFNENMGRHAFANDVIEPGEVICKFKVGIIFLLLWRGALVAWLHEILLGQSTAACSIKMSSNLAKAHSFCKWSSFFEKGILLTKPFQASQSWH